MRIQLCDRCGRVTKNQASFLRTCDDDDSVSREIMVGGSWFGKPITLCNNCLKDFEKFFISPRMYNLELVKED